MWQPGISNQRIPQPWLQYPPPSLPPPWTGRPGLPVTPAGFRPRAGQTSTPAPPTPRSFCPPTSTTQHWPRTPTKQRVSSGSTRSLKAQSNLDTERLTRNNRDPDCRICYNPVAGDHYYHPHISTQTQRIFAEEANQDRFFCIICKQQEVVKSPSRRKVVISSSTLANFYLDPSYKCENHFDVEILVGGKFRDGCRAWRRVYEHLSEPGDIILAMGINNISENQPLQDIMEELKEFHSDIKEHSNRHNHLVPNTLTICTVIQPPKFVCFSEERPYPHLTGGRNKKNQIEKLNESIRALNVEHGVWGPRLHIYGMRTHPKTGKHEHHDTFKDYSKVQPTWWKEPELHRRLHFTLEKRAYLAKKLEKHFLKTH